MLVERLVLVAVGGALGSAARYLVALGAARVIGAEFPYGTLIVNLAGAFVIGLVQELALDSFVMPEPARLFLATGLMGGLTTYSAFSYETVRLAQTGAWTRATINVGVTTGAGLALCLLGMVVARYLLRLRA
ncbi:MAG: fluoride efflux transporter CrcB [Candidatus Rokubacteria bacterium]|nr:fluoride efflux transporter CrcB [Candidatus Rokubacteria bacterium]